eukprot:g10212.t1
MGRNKPTHYVQKLKKLNKRLDNSGRKATAATVQKRYGKKSSETGKSFLKRRMETKIKNLQGLAQDELVTSLQSAKSRAQAYAQGLEEGEDPEIEEAGGLNKNREAENTRRKFYQELRKVVNASDVLIQVLDARDPDSCRNRAIEREVLCSKSKKMILLLNKVDLVPKEAAAAWMQRLQREFPTLLFKCGSGKGSNLTSAKDAKEGQLQSSAAVLGADSLLQLLKNYSRSSAGSKKAIAVGVVGYQEVILDSKIRLIDSPGVVFSGKSEDPSVVLRNAVKVETLKDPVRVVELLSKQIGLQKLVDHFDVDITVAATDDVDMDGTAAATNNAGGSSTSSLNAVRDFLIEIAQSRGQLKRGGAPDLSRAAVLALKEVACGKFRYHVLPPSREEEERHMIEGELGDDVGGGVVVNRGKLVVSTTKAEFNIDDIGEDDVVIRKGEAGNQEMDSG